MSAPLRRGDVVWVNLPRPSGTSKVQAGRRPAVILHTESSLGKLPVVIVVPGTSRTAATRFPHTVLVNPATSNGHSVPTVLLAFQIMAADASWIVTPRAGALDATDLGRIEHAVLEAIGATK